jgi:lipopolysaccharide biosynthesis regulator YciM
VHAAVEHGSPGSPKAVDSAHEAVRSTPDDRRTHAILGSLLQEAGKYPESVSALMRALDGDASRDKDVLRRLIVATHASGRGLDLARWMAAWEALHGPWPG